MESICIFLYTSNYTEKKNENVGGPENESINGKKEKRWFDSVRTQRLHTKKKSNNNNWIQEDGEKRKEISGRLWNGRTKEKPKPIHDCVPSVAVSFWKANEIKIKKERKKKKREKVTKQKAEAKKKYMKKKRRKRDGMVAAKKKKLRKKKKRHKKAKTIGWKLKNKEKEETEEDDRGPDNNKQKKKKKKKKKQKQKKNEWKKKPNVVSAPRSLVDAAAAEPPLRGDPKNQKKN